MAMARQALWQRREQQGWPQERLARALEVETPAWPLPPAGSLHLTRTVSKEKHR